MRPLSWVSVLAVVLIAPSACVSKTWVEQELDRRDARIDRSLSSAQGSTSDQTQRAQRDANLAQQQLTAVDQRVRVVDERVRVLEARTSELEDRTQGASARADGATARADGVDARLTRLWTSRNARSVVNILQVEFGFDQSVLDDAGKSMLFVLVRELRDNPELSLDLEGYTDSKGSHQYNVRLSQRRIDAVRRYLIEQGVERHRIKASARGPLENAAVPEERKRRVDVKLVVVAD